MFFVPLALVGLFVAVGLWVLRLGSRDKHLPPGPPTIPLLGNLHVFPKKYAHIQFSKWAQEYGGIFSLKVGPATAIVLSTAECVKAVMDQKSGNTADRPPIYLGDYVCDGMHMALARHGDVWRALRKTAHTILTPQGADEHIPIQRAESMQLLFDMLHDPQNFLRHIRRTTNSGILSVLYGKRCPRYETKDAADFFEVEVHWESAAAVSNMPPIDLLPFLKYVPERMGARWKGAWRRIKKLQNAFYYRIYEECEETVRSGREIGCFMEEVVKRRMEFGLSTKEAAYLGGTLIEGGTDTLASTLQTLVMALVAFPEAQKAAHEEMDRVVGNTHMPTLEEFGDLPYCQAVIKEAFRFRPALPIIVPHANHEADQYRGYVIPAQTSLYLNAWGVLHDPEAFDEPETFNPGRYLLTEFGTKVGYDDQHFRNSFQFGSGRRLCPGIHVADNALMLNVMALVWAFNFEQDLDSEGKPIPVDIYDMHDGLISGPNPFKCRITARSENHARMIDDAFAEVIPMFLPFETKLEGLENNWLESTRGNWLSKRKA